MDEEWMQRLGITDRAGRSRVRVTPPDAPETGAFPNYTERQGTSSGEKADATDRLSRDIYHMMPRLVNHPSIVITTYSTHDHIREAEGVKFSSKTLSLAMGDHAGTHVDAPVHFDASPDAQSIDQVPLEDFFTEAVCLDLSHKELKSDISIEDLEQAIEVAGVEIKPKDTVLLHMNFYNGATARPDT